MNNKKPLLTDVTYDRLKHLVQIILPAAGTMYAALAMIWGLPYGEQVVATIMAITLFLGATLKISTKSYNANDESFDGVLKINTDDENKDVWSIDLNQSFETLETKPVLQIKVHREDV